MECILNEPYNESFLCFKNNVATRVSDEFMELFGFSNDKYIGKTMKEISSMLKIDSQISLENIVDKCSCYIFTKELEPIEGTLYCQNISFTNEKTFFFKKNLNSCVKEQFDFVKQLYTSSKTGFAIFSIPNLILLKANTNYINSFDYPDNKISNSIGKKLKEVCTGYKGSNAEKIWKDVIDTKKAFYMDEMQYEYFKRGTTYWNTSIVPIFINGKLKFIVNTVLDVTEKVLDRKILDEKNKIIREQKEELDVILENMSDKVVTIDKDCKATFINNVDTDNPIYDIVTRNNDPKEFKYGKYIDISGNSISYEDMPVQKVIRGEKVYRDLLIEKNDNSNIYTIVSGTPKYNSAGEVVGGVMIYRDMTERIKAQESIILKTQYKALETIIKKLDLGCTIATYPDLNIRYTNDKCFSILKKINLEGDLQEIIGRNVLTLFKFNKFENMKVEINLKELSEKRVNSYFIYKKYIDAGEEKFLKIMCQPIFGINNIIREVIFLQFDITEEIKANNKMEETLRIQDEMFSNISHELKTPLNVIFSTNQLMEFYLKNNSLIEDNKNKFLRNINVIKQNCYRFTKIINNIIDISKIESGFLKLNLSNENIVTIIEDIVQSVSGYVNSKKLNIVFDTDIEEKIIACDPYKIERIILNLISNSIKFTNEGGNIFVNISDKDDLVEISVKDTGIGMDEKSLKNIFKRFHQVDKSLSRNAEGSGIGLSLVKSIIELHGGTIDVESKIQEGSIFKVLLPAKKINDSKIVQGSKSINSKIEMINIEFSDIYSIS